MSGCRKDTRDKSVTLVVLVQTSMTFQSETPSPLLPCRVTRDGCGGTSVDLPGVVTLVAC